MSRTLVVGDIHNGYRALKQVLERSKFDYDNDTLISLGDIVDGWGDAPQVIDELLKVKNLIDYFQLGTTPPIWTEQGGWATLRAYLKDPTKIIDHRNFFDKAVYYYIDDQNRLFVHGGLLKDVNIKDHTKGDLMWDRTLVTRCFSSKDFKGDDRYKEIYVGHTSTMYLGYDTPLIRGNVICLDQGAATEMENCQLWTLKQKSFGNLTP
jgi:serine/threonine protein phosphatase 1